ncbi:MAG TPA: hypothetical protein VG318_15295 [Actinomycetota bacterium]|nr:hypothetical protein [Actinomycetota bacterium]
MAGGVDQRPEEKPEAARKSNTKRRTGPPSDVTRRKVAIPAPPQQAASRRERVKQKQLKRPAETTTGLAALATVLVSLTGLTGSSAEEITAAMTAVVGLIPIVVSKFVDWKRNADLRNAERDDLLERGVRALESIVGQSGKDVTVRDVAAVLRGEVDLDKEDGAVVKA